MLCMQALPPYPTNNTQEGKKKRKEFKVASQRRTMMKVANLIAVFILLALASSFVTAYDPSPLQDFCVAIDDANSAGTFKIVIFRNHELLYVFHFEFAFQLITFCLCLQFLLMENCVRIQASPLLMISRTRGLMFLETHQINLEHVLISLQPI